MIQLSNTAIMIVRPDSSSIPFDVEEIQTRIIRACIAAGETESWIAGDISLSVEFALLSTKGRFIKESDLDSLIIRALEDSGYPHVAADFKRSAAPAAPSDLPVNAKSIQNAVAANLSLPPGERLDAIVAEVETALRAIGFERCSPRLMLELARQFRDRETSALPPIPLKTHPLKPGGDILLLQQSDFRELGSLNLKDLLSGGTLRIHGISRLFPALRIDVSFPNFADAMELSKPVSELALLSSWSRLLSGIDEICEKADHFCRSEQLPVTLPLPLCLNFRDALEFAVNYMNCPQATATECIRGVLGDFTNALVRKPFKVNVD